MNTELKSHEFQDWKIYFVTGILIVILGITALYVPAAFGVTLTIILGWLFIIGGVIQFFIAFKRKDNLTTTVSIISALALLIIGILLLSKPVTATIALSLLLSIYFFVQGIIQIFLAFVLRPLPNWGWMFLSGIIGILLAIIVWSNWPIHVAAFLGIVAGVYLLFWGLSELMLAMAVRGLQKHG